MFQKVTSSVAPSFAVIQTPPLLAHGVTIGCLTGMTGRARHAESEEREPRRSR
jgi:hypothetical protein